MEEAIIQIENLVVNYGRPGPRQVQALKGVSLEVYRGEIFGLLGPNGAGKTTLLSVLEGLVKPGSGRVRVQGIDVTRDPTGVRRLLGTQLQQTALIDDLTVEELIYLYASLYQVFLTKEQIYSLLERFDLVEQRRVYPRRLSGGQRQRLAVAAAIAHDPQIVLLDEPTSALDPQARRKIWGMIRSLHEDGRTVILTTHSMEEAELLSGRVSIIDRGQQVAEGSPARLIASLDAGTMISTVLELPLEEVQAVPGVVKARYTGQHLEVESWQPNETLAALTALAERYRQPLGEVSMRQPNLEDVFLHLTGRALQV